MFKFNHDDDDDDILNILSPSKKPVRTDSSKTDSGRSDVRKRKEVTFSEDNITKENRYSKGDGGDDRASSSLTKALPWSTNSQFNDECRNNEKNGIVTQQQLSYHSKNNAVADPPSFSRKKGIKSNTLIDIDDILRVEDDDEDEDDYDYDDYGDVSITNNENKPTEEDEQNLKIDPGTTTAIRVKEARSDDNQQR